MKKQTTKQTALAIAMAAHNRPTEGVRPEETTSAEYAKEAGCTVKNAQLVLERLVEQGALTRREALSPAGRRCIAYGPPTNK